ncbi:FadR/GntR family transcriptional regulator [Actinocorallia longicatena]|uniref:FadR/GntR family transcriptional regulator n=1 Tax=Actinocorallia longicatena TaxID=111803 RepID=A0ABP6QFE7_9ACTN
MTDPIARDTVVDALVNRLRTEILGGLYPPGSYLPPERELAAGYQVTRTSLKHALVRLAQAGLLETRHGVGTRVRDYERLGGPELLPMLVRVAGPDWAAEIFDARREIGALVAAQAAARASLGHRAHLSDALTALRSAADPQQGEAEIHRLIAAATGNRVYSLLVNSLLNAYLEVGDLFRHVFTDAETTADRIEPLVRAIADGDPAQAHEEAVRYLDRTRDLMIGALK